MAVQEKGFREKESVAVQEKGLVAVLQSGSVAVQEKGSTVYYFFSHLE